MSSSKGLSQIKGKKNRCETLLGIRDLRKLKKIMTWTLVKLSQKLRLKKLKVRQIKRHIKDKVVRTFHYLIFPDATQLLVCMPLQTSGHIQVLTSASPTDSLSSYAKKAWRYLWRKINKKMLPNLEQGSKHLIKSLRRCKNKRTKKGN